MHLIFQKQKNLPISNIILPHFLVRDEAFSIDTFMMKPYARRVAKNDWSKETFNYRLYRARRVSGNAFGLLSQVFRIFYTPIGKAPETCIDMILVACCLHNLLRDGLFESAQMPAYIKWTKKKIYLQVIYVTARSSRLARTTCHTACLSWFHSTYVSFQIFILCKINKIKISHLFYLCF